MLHVIAPADHAKNHDLLEQSFKVRHDIFVKECGWRALERPDGNEIDQFDDEYTTYVLATEKRRVIGGLRLYPTTRPHMISEVFSYLVEGTEVPVADDVFEWSRIFVVSDWRDGPLYYQLLAALQEICFDQAVSQVSAVVRLFRVPWLQQLGFQVRPLGLPQMVEGTETLAVTIEPTLESLACVRQRARLRGPALRPHSFRSIRRENRISLVA